MSGSLDISTAGKFAESVGAASGLRVHPVVVLDLTGVDVLGGAGVREPFHARDQYAAHNHQLVTFCAAQMRSRAVGAPQVLIPTARRLRSAVRIDCCRAAV